MPRSTNAARRKFSRAAARSSPCPAPNGKITPDAVAARLTERGFVHHAQPAAITISQTTEAGTLYRPAGPCGARRLRASARHGASCRWRAFGNAVAALGCAPADITWRAGVDALVRSAATKNGALAAEAVIFFDPDAARELGLSQEARRASLLEDAVPVGAARRLSRGRAVAAQRAAREPHGGAARVGPRAPESRAPAPSGRGERSLRRAARARHPRARR